MIRDPVDRALAALRAADRLEPPDRALEARLVARHRWTRRRPRLWPLGLGVALLGGVAFAGGGGVEWLRSLWFSVEVDGRRVEGRLDGDGRRSLELATDTGGTARVDVGRETLADGATRTHVTIEQREDGGVELEEHAEELAGGSAPGEWLALAELAGATRVHDGVDADGRRFTLWFLPGPPVARLALQRPHVDAGRAEVIGRLHDLPATVAPAFVCELLANGDVAVRLSAAGAFDFEVLVRLTDGDAPAPPPPTSLSTPDGRVKVRLEPDRPR